MQFVIFMLKDDYENIVNKKLKIAGKSIKTAV